jgi:hypothetical protein
MTCQASRYDRASQAGHTGSAWQQVQRL